MPRTTWSERCATACSAARPRPARWLRRSCASGWWSTDSGYLGRAPVVLLRVARLPEALCEPGELEVRRAALLERHARLEEAARLAPQPHLRAKAAERREELRVAGVLEQPAFGVLDALVRFAVPPGLGHLGRELGIQRDQLRRPFRGERALQDLARHLALAQLGGVACGRRGDARMDLIARLDAAPAPLEGVLVCRGERGRDGIALAELGGEAQHLVPGARAAFGAQQHAGGGDLLRPCAMQVAQRTARAGEVAVLQ